MKTKIRRAIYWVVIVFSYVMAQAQGGYDDNTVVDVSVRAGVDEQAEQPPERGAKQPAVLSSWSFQAARAPSAEKNMPLGFSNFQPLRQVPASTILPKGARTNTVADASAKRRFSTPMEMPNYLGILPPKYGHGSATQPPPLTAPVSPGSRLHGNQEFPNLFDQNLFGMASYYSLSKTTYPAARGGRSAWQHKPRATKSSDVLSTTVPLDPLAKQKR
jgi:hypothetical protein